MMAGAIVALVAPLEGWSSLQQVRTWSARTLRSFEHHGQRVETAAKALAEAPLGTVTAPSVLRPLMEPIGPDDAPCTTTFRPEDDCEALLAPFAATAAGPSVPVESLPHVRPPIVVAMHRTHPARAVRPAVVPPPPDAEEDEPPSETASNDIPFGLAR
jgi:hypothetical protein